EQMGRRVHRGKRERMARPHICTSPMLIVRTDPPDFQQLTARASYTLASIPIIPQQTVRTRMIMPGHVSRVKQGKLEPKEKREKKAIRDLREPPVPKANRGRKVIRATPAPKVIKETPVPECRMWMYSIISPQVPPLF